MTKSKISNWSLIVALLLLAWGLRLCRLENVPPGWRDDELINIHALSDDELINIHALSDELLAGHFPLYFTGASGHEPLYHYLHAGLHAVLGFNVLSGHLLSAALGTLTVALTFALTRRLFRHISLLPFALAAFYLLWREKPGFSEKTRFLLVGLIVGISLYTYPAARLLPVLLVLFAAYLALFHRASHRRKQAAPGARPGTAQSVNSGNPCSYWRGFLLALAIVAVLAAPLAVVIAQGRSEAAAQGIGADARLAELAVPLRELWAGNPRPLLENVWATLGMFHTTGDPEWLYNISDRPVFNMLGGALLWAGVALCLLLFPPAVVCPGTAPHLCQHPARQPEPHHPGPARRLHPPRPGDK